MRSISRATLLLALLLLPVLATAQDAREEVLAADARRFAAMIQGDQAALDRLLADDLTYTHSSGQLETKAQFLESLRSGKLRYLSAERSDVAVRLYGDTAVVTGRAEVKVSTGGEEGVLPLRFTEVWVKSGGGWKLTAWQSTRIAG
jgi:ketosteroid isomerase-like protein